MSYADVTAKNAHQTPQEAAAPQLPEVVHTDDSTSSLIDVDSPHISSVPSDYESQSVKTDTQSARIEREAEDAKIQAESKAKKGASEAKKSAEKGADKAKSKLTKGKQAAQDNPVMLGNAIIVGVLGTVLGVGAYRKYTAGEFSWKLAGTWAGVVGLFAGVDYFATSFLYKKYPPKN